MPRTTGKGPEQRTQIAIHTVATRVSHTDQSAALRGTCSHTPAVMRMFCQKLLPPLTRLAADCCTMYAKTKDIAYMCMCGGF